MAARIALFIALCALAVAPARAVDLSGAWQVDFLDMPGGEIGDSCRFTFAQSGPDQVAGKLTGCGLGTEGIFHGTLAPDGALHLVIVAPDDVGCEIYTIDATAAPDGQSIDGTFLCKTPLSFSGPVEAARCDAGLPGDCPGATSPALPLSVCFANAPATGCKVSTTAKAKVALSREGPFDYKLTARIPRATDTDLAELGDPFAAQDYVACVYETVAGQPRLIAAEPVLAPAVCSKAPCWKASGNGLKFKNNPGPGSKLRSLKLKAGVGGKASAGAKGGLSTDTAISPAPLGLPVTVQLVAGDTCWRADFPTATTNADGKFSAKGGQ